MLAALIAGQRDPKTLAQMAHGVMRRRIGQLQEALTGHFEAHHAFLTAAMLRRIDALSSDIAEVDTRIEAAIAPYAAAVHQLDEIAGVGARSAQEIIAEVGVDMAVFPTAGHLASWAKFAPIDNQSAGRTKTAATGKGNPWLAATLGESVAALARTDTHLGDRYRRLVRRRGKKRAIVAVGNTLLTIIWHLLSDPDTHCHDLGSDYYESKINKRRRERDLIHQLEHLTGHKVSLNPVA
jgi:transposase